MKLGAQIKRWREFRQLSQPELAQRCGWASQGRISNYETDKREPSFDDLQKIADALQVPVRDLLDRDPSAAPEARFEKLFRPIIEWEKPEDLPEGQYVIVPRVKVRLSAGNGQLIFEEEEGEPLAFTTRWVKSRGLCRSQLVLVQATGDSMEPRIQDGDLLLIDRAQTAVQDGHVYALRYGDELRVKRLHQRYDGGLIIRSDNVGKYPDEAVPQADLTHIEVIGRIVWVAGEM